MLIRPSNPILIVLSVGLFLVSVALFIADPFGEKGRLETAVAGEARQGGLSLALAPAVADVRITEAGQRSLRGEVLQIEGQPA